MVVDGTIPTVMAQWDYVQGIGVEKLGINGAGSDIFCGQGEEDDGGRGQEWEPLTTKNQNGKLLNNQGEHEEKEEDEIPGWENVIKTNSVWTLN